MYSLPSLSTILLSFLISFILSSFPSPITTQQPYSTSICNRKTPSSSGYTCNGLNKTCQTYLIYRAQPPYNTANSIATLLSTNPSQISKINNISYTQILPTTKEIIVPINCSCSTGNKYYQKNTTYKVVRGDTHYLISNNTYQGLTTCLAIQNQRTGLAVNIYPGEKLTIPIRCACPTKKQTDLGIKYLMSYVIKKGDAIASISTRFEADVGMTLVANQKSEQDFLIYPFTTLLIPLEKPPNSSQTITPEPSPPTESSPPMVSAPMESPSTRNETGTSNKNWIYFSAGIAAGGAFVLVIITSGVLVFFFLVYKRPRAANAIEPIVSSQSNEIAATKNGVKSTELEDFLNSVTNVAHSLKVYSFKDIESATNNFSTTSSWIKGSVYKARIDGDYAAIKKIDTEFTAEIELLNKINHFNIITLLGICFHQGQWYLVYEYAANGTLNDWLKGESTDHLKSLSWCQRLQICLDVATGLDYLHSYTTPPIVHKDITSGNILLDRDFRAKITNLRQSRSIRGGGQQRVHEFTTTEHIVGTKGYLAPEYLENGFVSPKLDVYAFGLLMLEMITGKDVHLLYQEVDFQVSELLVPVLVSEEDGKERVRGLIDQSLEKKNYSSEVAISVVRLIDTCLSKDPGIRPGMDEIVRFLSKALTISLVWESSTTNNNILM